MGSDVTAALLVLAYKAIGVTFLTGVFLALLAQIDFTHTITLGSVLLGIIILAVAALFTIRSKVADIWREEAEGERSAKERCHAALVEEKRAHLDFEREQQELRHDLKGEIAGLKAQIKVMEAKTDLSAAMELIQQMSQDGIAAISDKITETFVERSKAEHDETHKLLVEIRDKLPEQPVEVVVKPKRNEEPR